MDTASLSLRPGTPDDADALAELLTAARRAAVPMMPPPVHTAAEDRAWVGRQLAGEREVWVAEGAGALVGYLILEPGWLHSLYVRPGLKGQGIGSFLLDFVKGLRPEGFALWVFESNEPARRFYRRHGLVEIRRTDGADNEERAPDVEMAWLGEEPFGALRRRIDAVDDELADLLDRRAALTAHVQRLKEVPGQAGRDPDREAEIATRMARRAPRLGRERVQRIMHAVITESLDAAEKTLEENAPES
ncbi:MAG TPA: GNAT family N-acetyltransferase [Nocardioidaceae bacterium]|nr:GNAT family N-acetyltransferase [Nocardioidaceae bacterium]